MDRRTVLSLGIVVLSLVASGFIAASFSAPVPSGPSSGGSASDGSSGGGIAGPPPASGERLTVVTVPWIDELFFILLGGTILFVTIYVWFYRTEYRSLFVATSVLMLSVVVFIELFTTSDGNASLLYALLAELVGAGADDPPTGIRSNHTISILVTIILLCIGAAGIAARIGLPEYQEQTEPPTETTPDDQSVHAIGRAAGRAADRLETDQSVENEIYRAWKEMTQLLTVSQPTDSMTPQEFADHAISIGMHPNDVTDLTRLFEDVRYGGYPATTDREEKARSLFRRIETTYTPSDR